MRRQGFRKSAKMLMNQAVWTNRTAGA
jgi:hypothetical protein